MITQKDIKASYIKILRKSCPEIKKIYETAVEEGYMTPSFFVQMIPLEFRKRRTASVVSSKYMIETTYLEYKKNEVDQIDIADKIRTGVGDYLEIGDRKIPIMDPEIEYTGQTRNIMQFVFYIEFYEDVREIEKENIVQKIQVKEEIKNGNAID
ncbi:MAG: hypothetical protein MRZ63_09625 [Anaerostipes sp.]|nr:hypothetical protein [Anaerostipes sp.]